MKKTVFPLALILLSLLANAQSPYVSYEDSTHKGTLILNGLISKYILIMMKKILNGISTAIMGIVLRQPC